VADLKKITLITKSLKFWKKVKWIKRLAIVRNA
jgi:hypothetical protein